MIQPATALVTRLSPRLLRVTAPNPSPMTAEGTNAYVIEGAACCLVDPGPNDARQLVALLAALEGRPVSHVIVTHSHADHGGLAPTLARATGAAVRAGGDLAEGEEVAGDGWRLRAIRTPGHTPDHVCLDGGADLFTGDLAMGWASSLVDPPEGDMADYMRSLRRLLALGPRRLLPGHGPVVEDGAARLRAQIAHREAREAQVLALLAEPLTPQEVAARIYQGLSGALLWAAQRNVLAHVLDLRARGLVTALDGRAGTFVATGRPPGRLL